MTSAIKIEPEQQNFLDNHFGISPQWGDFHKQLKNKSFVDAVKADTRSDDKLKIFAQVIGTRDQSKGRSLKVPSDVSGSYNVKYHPDIDRFSCTCPDWTYKRSVGGGDCKHIDRIKTKAKNNLMKKIASMPAASTIFSIGRTINREHKDKATTARLKEENKVYNQTYPQPGLVSQWLKHAAAQENLPLYRKQFRDNFEMTKKMAQAAKKLLTI